MLVDWKRKVDKSSISTLQAEPVIQSENVYLPLNFELWKCDRKGEVIGKLASGIIDDVNTKRFNLNSYLVEGEDVFVKITLKGTDFNNKELSAESKSLLINPMRPDIEFADISENEFYAHKISVIGSEGEVKKTIFLNYLDGEQGFVLRRTQKSNFDMFFENMTNDFVRLEISVYKYKDISKSDFLEGNRNSTVNIDYEKNKIYVDLSPCSPEVLVIPSGYSADENVVKVWKGSVHLMDWFKRKYGNTVPRSDMKIRFIIPKYQHIISYMYDYIDNVRDVTYEPIQSLGITEPNFVEVGASAISDKISSPIVIGDGTYHSDEAVRNPKWNGCKILVEVKSILRAAGGVGAPYYTDRKNRKGSIVLTGQDGYPIFNNNNTDAKVRCLVDGGEITSGGGGSGMTPVCKYLLRITDSEGNYIYEDRIHVSVQSGGDAAPFGTRSTTLGSQRNGVATETEGSLTYSNYVTANDFTPSNVTTYSFDDGEHEVTFKSLPAIGGSIGSDGLQAKYPIANIKGRASLSIIEEGEILASGLAGLVSNSNNISVFGINKGTVTTRELKGELPPPPNDIWDF